MVPVASTTEHNFVPYGNDLGLGKIPIRKQLSIDNNIIPIKVTTGNAPNNLEIISNIVEDTYAISEENSEEQGIINKINVLPNQSNLTPITIMVVDTISAVKSRRLLKVLLDSGSTMTIIKKIAKPTKKQKIKW
jgi:hypothetical protein